MVNESALTADEEQRRTLLANWRQLADKVDAFFSAAQSRTPAAFACQSGCTACCQQELTVLLVEALAIDAYLDQLPAAEREEIAQRAARQGPPCAFLGPDGRCAIYDARPLVCRTHGLPIRQQMHDGDSAGQPSISVCELNFTDGDIKPDSVLDGTTLIATLTVVDDLTRQRLEMAQPVRVPLRRLARDGLAGIG